MTNVDCFGQHRIHVAEIVVNQTEGKVTVLALCISCGEPFVNEHIVSAPGSVITRLEKEKIQ